MSRVFILFFSLCLPILAGTVLAQVLSNGKKKKEIAEYESYDLISTKIQSTKEYLTASTLHLDQLSDDQFLERIQYDYTKLCLESKDSIVTVELDGYNINLYPVAVENGWMDRKIAAKEILQYLKEFDNAKTIQGFFPRSFNRITGEKATIHYWTFGRPYDVYGTAVIAASLKLNILNYFHKQNPVETEIRRLCNKIIDRIDWNFAYNETKGCFTWFKNGENGEQFDGKELLGIWDETFFIQLMAVNDKKWAHGLHAYNHFTSKLKLDSLYGYPFYPTLQIGYSAQSFLWFNLRDYKDSTSIKNNLSYFTSIQNAVSIQKEFAMRNPNKYPHYGTIWGFTDVNNDTGDIQLEEVIGSINFNPDEAISCLRNIYEMYKTKNIYSEKGMHGKINTLTGEIQPLERNKSWYGFYLPLNVMYIENYRSGLFWKLAQSAPDYASILEKVGINSNPKM